MKKTELKNSEAKKPIQVRLNPKDGLSSKEQNPKTEQEKILEGAKTMENFINNTKKGEEAEIIHEMDEIIKNNDKFETIRVIMEILCKELDISKESQFPTIAGAVQGVVERYYKSMEDWKNLRKQGQK